MEHEDCTESGICWCGGTHHGSDGWCGIDLECWHGPSAPHITPQDRLSTAKEEIQNELKDVEKALMEKDDEYLFGIQEGLKRALRRFEK